MPAAAGFNVLHALAAECLAVEERAALAADLASPVAPLPVPDLSEGPDVVVPDEIPAWMQGLIP